MRQLLKLTSVMRTPSASSISGILASPNSRKACSRKSGNGTLNAANSMPAIMASIIGLANMRSVARRGPCRPLSSKRMPSVKYTRLQAMNKATASDRPAEPKASTASGKPMLPQLLYIIGGTKVRGS